MRNALMVAFLAVVSSCVSQSTFDALQSQKDAVQTTLEERNKALAEAEKKIARLEADQKAMEAQLAEAEQQAKDLDARLLKAREEMAAVTRDKSKLQASVEEMARAMSALEKRKAEAEARVAEFKNLLSRFRALIDAGKLKVKIVDGRMVVVLATDILFASGSASLSKDGKAAIAEVAQVLASIPKRSFQVEGHTDNVPIATAQYPSNWELAAGRAINVLKAMVDAGMPTGRISAASFGDSRPVAPNDDKESKAQNRRIEIIIVPDLSTLPGFDELKKIEKEG